MEIDVDTETKKIGLPGSLTSQQVSLFRSSGYLRLPVRLPNAEAQKLGALLNSELRSTSALYNGQGRPFRVNNLAGRNPKWMALATQPELLDSLESLLGPNIVFFENRHNHGTLTLPDANPPRLHRDVLQWSRSIVTVIIYLEPSNVSNGCTEIIPGSHMLPFVGTPNNGGTWMDEHSVYADLLDQALPIPMPIGGMLAIDGLAFHRAGINSTTNSRAVATFAYCAVDELSDGAISSRRLVRGNDLYRGNDQTYPAG